MVAIIAFVWLLLLAAFLMDAPYHHALPADEQIYNVNRKFNAITYCNSAIIA